MVLPLYETKWSLPIIKELAEITKYGDETLLVPKLYNHLRYVNDVMVPE